MRQTGIYKITNLSNGKFYIGQSRDIFLAGNHTHYQSMTIQMNLLLGCHLRNTN